MIRLANFISLIFDPVIVTIVALILIISQSEKDLVRIVGWFIIIFLIGVLPPLVFLIYEKKRGKVTDWFLYKRAERIPIYIATLLSLSVALVMVWLLDGPYTLLVFSLTSLINATSLGLATYLGHKVSVHASSITFFVLVILTLFGFKFWPIILLIPMVGWSRLVLKKHTLQQLIGGVAITTLVVFLTLKLFAFV